MIPVLCHVILTPSMSSCTHILNACLCPAQMSFSISSLLHFLCLIFIFRFSPHTPYITHFPLLNNQSSNYLYHLLFIISANPVYRYIGPPSSPSGTYPFLLGFPTNHPVSILEASAPKLQTRGCPKAPNREREQHVFNALSASMCTWLHWECHN
jgi:hypothetical protein